jgi:SAM-dependent methyltransferase
MSSRRKETLKVVLRRGRLLPLAFRVHEHARTLAGRWQRSPVVDDGLAVPPPALRTRVAGTADAAWFLASGREHAEMISEVLQTVGAPLEDAEAILDFGCGCGRVVRHWHHLGAAIHGTDHDRPAIDWCYANLAFGTFDVNEVEPPLSYPEGMFDLVYAISVFTHTSEALQRAWLADLARVVRPGGHLLLTTHGEWCARKKLLPDEWRRFESGSLVVRDEAAGGSNLCAAFHPDSYVREDLAEELTEALFCPGSAQGLDQDLWVFRKPGATTHRDP